MVFYRILRAEHGARPIPVLTRSLPLKTNTLQPITGMDDFEHYIHDDLGMFAHMSYSVLSHMSFEREVLAEAKKKEGDAKVPRADAATGTEAEAAG